MLDVPVLGSELILHPNVNVNVMPAFIVHLTPHRDAPLKLSHLMS